MVNESKLQSGLKVDVFEDPVTEELPEGRATLRRETGVEHARLSEQEELRHYIVIFKDDEGRYEVERWVKVKLGA